MVYLKQFFENVDFEENQQMTKKIMKTYPAYRVTSYPAGSCILVKFGVSPVNYLDLYILRMLTMLQFFIQLTCRILVISMYLQAECVPGSVMFSKQDKSRFSMLRVKIFRNTEHCHRKHHNTRK